MIKFDSFVLANGLKVHVIPDKSVKTAVLNIAYDVGSKDEHPNKTGFAHLFEHLMFGGSVNIPEYDIPLQKVGGENNAFTTPDFTNYYLSVPSNNIETGFWLESDRMLNLSFDPNVLEVQRKVVIEEFKQRYLNRPYGDVWHKLRPLAYKTHPYRWPVIGEKIEHIEEAEMGDVRNFFDQHYTPDNAVLVIGGDVEFNQVQDLCAKWFEPIKKQSSYHRNLPQEPMQSEKRKLIYNADVPQDAFYSVYHMPGKSHAHYHSIDLLSDLLGRGKSSRLYTVLVKQKEIFNSISANVMGTVDPGLLVIQGMVKKGVTLEQAEFEVENVIAQINSLEEEEFQKIRNQALSSLAFSQVEILEQAMSLSFASLKGNAEDVNREEDNIRAVTPEDINLMAKKYLTPANNSVLHYSKKK